MDNIRPKIGIMTFYAVHNNGAVLQAFALQQKLKSLGADVELIRYFDKHNEKQVVRHSRLYNLLHNKAVFTNVLFHPRRYLALRGKSLLTDKAYDDFAYKYLQPSIEPYYEYADLADANRRYHGFVVGSDMVWTPIGQNLKAYFLQFAEKQKRYSYSPSLTGTSSFSESDKSEIISYLKDFPYLSCREKEGVDFIKEELDREAIHTLDPTMLFDKEEWRRELSISSSDDNSPYILCYIFGGLSKNLKSEVKRISKERNMSVRFIPMLPEEQYAEIQNGHVCGYGPKEFVELFLNASFIVTNTYHGLMFSLISEKPFVLIHRETNNAWKSNEGRMSNMLDKLHLSDRYLEKTSNINEEFLNLDYNSISQIIQEERNKSCDYLETIVELISKNCLTPREVISTIASISDKECMGCAACYQACPFSAITMRQNSEGFLYPIIDESLCKDCGLCTKTCPSYNKPDKNTPIASYIAISNNCNIDNSASGGGIHYSG